MRGIRHYETRYKSDYIAKLRENLDTGECSEIVFFQGAQIHAASFPTSNLGDASRGGYLRCMVASVARKHSKKERA